MIINTPSSTLWTEEQLQEVLYHGDNQSSPIIEYPPSPDFNNTNDTTVALLHFSHPATTASYIVEFYSPWCPHCQNYKSHYIRLAKQVTRRTLVSTDSFIFFVAVSCTLHSDLCSNYDVEGFPTLMVWGPNVGHGTHESTYTNTSKPGLVLDSPSITPEYIADMLGIELVHKTPKVPQKVKHKGSSSNPLDNSTQIDNSVQEDDDGKVTDDYYYEEVITPSPREALHLANKAAWDKIHSFQYLVPNPILSNHTISFEDLWTQTKNYRFHDAANSLIFLLQNALTLHLTSTHLIPNSTSPSLQQRQESVFIEFLFLLDWALPPTWHIRTGLVHDLLSELDNMSQPMSHESDVPKNTSALLWSNPLLKQKLVQIVHNESITSFKDSSNLSSIPAIPWGFISLTPNSVTSHPSSTDVKKNASLSSTWSSLCTHIYDRSSNTINASSHTFNASNTSLNHPRRPVSRTTGYTCGLWELFHILSIGSSLPQQQIYGHLMGYTTSSHQVARTIKQVIELFFGCDVCRKNFVTMYDSCGHNHCKRFKPLSLPSFIDTHPTSIRGIQRTDWDSPTNEGKDLVIWLWEVHNAVNVRLMSENAQREKRSLSVVESLAGKFPTKVMCPSCWKDSHMNRANHDQVYTFLRELYWPGYNLPLNDGRLWLRAINTPTDASSSTRINEREQPLRTYRAEQGGEPISFFGLFCICLPLLFIGGMFAVKVMSMNRHKGGKRS